MILVSYDDFDQLAEFDPHTTVLQLRSRKQHPGLTKLVVGSFARVNGEQMFLYRSGNILYLRIGQQEFPLTDDVSSELKYKDQSKHREFRLLRGQDTLVTVTYLPPELEIPLEIDPTPGVDAEHFDYLLFIHNVLTQTGRRYRVWNQ